MGVLVFGFSSLFLLKLLQQRDFFANSLQLHQSLENSRDRRDHVSKAQLAIVVALILPYQSLVECDRAYILLY